MYFSVLFVLFHLQNPQNTKLYFSAGLELAVCELRCEIVSHNNYRSKFGYLWSLCSES
jgi:hypothetical protein